MRFSEAVRLGSMLGPQGFGTQYYRPANTLCVTEAANMAMRGTRDTSVFDIWPELLIDSTCPVCEIQSTLGSMIACCLNDKHKWTREQVADWYERTYETPALVEAHEPARVQLNFT